MIYARSIGYAVTQPIQMTTGRKPWKKALSQSPSGSRDVILEPHKS